MVGGVELFVYILSWFGFGYVVEKMFYKVCVFLFRFLYEQGLEWYQFGGWILISLFLVIIVDVVVVGGFSGLIMGIMFFIVVNFLIVIILSYIVNWRIVVVCFVIVLLFLGFGIMQVCFLLQFECKYVGVFFSVFGIIFEVVNLFKIVIFLLLEKEVFISYCWVFKVFCKEMILVSVYINFWFVIVNSIFGIIYVFVFWWGFICIVKGQVMQMEFFIIFILMFVSVQFWGYMFVLVFEFI